MYSASMKSQTWRRCWRARRVSADLRFAVRGVAYGDLAGGSNEHWRTCILLSEELRLTTLPEGPTGDGGFAFSMYEKLRVAMPSSPRGDGEFVFCKCEDQAWRLCWRTRRVSADLHSTDANSLPPPFTAHPLPSARKPFSSVRPLLQVPWRATPAWNSLPQRRHRRRKRPAMRLLSLPAAQMEPFCPAVFPRAACPKNPGTTW